MKAAVRRAMQAYEEIRTSKDGRQYVSVSDVLNSPAGRAEIRMHGEVFKILKEKQTNGAKSTNENADE
jgi:hypothetical protein